MCLFGVGRQLRGSVVRERWIVGVKCKWEKAKPVSFG